MRISGSFKLKHYAASWSRVSEMILAVSDVLGPVYTLWQELLWRWIHQLESKAIQKLLYWPSPEKSDMHAVHSRWQWTCRSTRKMIWTGNRNHRTRQKLAHASYWWNIFSPTAVPMMLMMKKQLPFIRWYRPITTVITTVTQVWHYLLSWHSSIHSHLHNLCFSEPLWQHVRSATCSSKWSFSTNLEI